MRLIGINRAKPGDIIGQAVLGMDGCPMLKSGVILTEKYIEKLIALGINYIYIKDDKLTDIVPEDPKFLEVKSEAIKSLSSVFSRLQYNDNSIDIKNTLAAITDIVEYLIDNKEINCSYLTEIKTFDNYTYVHSLNTCVLALFFGVQMNFSRSLLIDLGAGALLHDIGKTKVPKEILNKVGTLTEEEFDIMKKHPEYGYDIVKDLDYINERGKKIVLEHHEKINGSGYPFGLVGDQISKFSRIVCISDVYDAIVSDRVYRRGFPENEAYEFVLGGAGTYFDLEFVNVFKSNFSIYPLGVCVKLSNGLEGFVVKHNKGFPDKPYVRVLYDENGMITVPTEINLVETLDVCIENIIV